MRRSILLALLLAALPAAARAQTVAGELVEPGAIVGVAGARVILLDASGRRVAAGLTSLDGSFTLRAPAGGRYTLRAERVGYRPTVTEPIVLAAGETVHRQLVAEPQRTGLAGITVESGARCEVHPGSGAAAAAVWDEARKALDLTQAGITERHYRFRVAHYARDEDPEDRHVRAEEAKTTEGVTDHPFVTLPAAELAEKGYVLRDGDSIVYNAPDAAVLLSDAFLDTHCFRVVPDRADTTRLGLAFEPVRGRRLPDVRGTLWLDRRTAELRTLEYEYTNPPLKGPGGIPGGEIRFRRLPNGSWLAARWTLRMPTAGERRDEYVFAPASGPVKLALIREEGGEVTGITTTSGAPVDTAAASVLAGVVFDSTRAAPLAGARVYLSGTGYSATTDTAGRYVIRGVRDGSYRLGFGAPRLDSLGFTPAPVPVTVSGAQTLRRDLAVPPLGTVLAAACAKEGGVLAGVVREGSGGEALPGAQVTLTWQAGGASRTAQARTDAEGVYRFCEAPTGVPARLTATALGATVQAGELRVEPGAPTVRDVVIRIVGAPAAAAHAGPARRTSQVVTREEVERAGYENAWDLLHRLRPQWFTVTGQHSFAVDTLRDETGRVHPDQFGREAVVMQLSRVVVYVDGAQLQTPEGLRNVPASAVQHAEYLDPIEASSRFGTQHANGAILVTTMGTGGAGGGGSPLDR